MREIRAGLAVVVSLVIGALALGAVPALAEDVSIVAPPPPPERRLLVDPGRREEARPGDQVYYPGHGPLVPYEPSFVRPLSTEPDAAARLGVAGWTSPNMAVGPSSADSREINGWLAFGFAWTWGGSPPTVRR
jgi:hypothetical protein